MKAWIVVILSFFTMGCAQNMGATHRYYHLPRLNASITKEVGTPILRACWGVQYDCSYLVVEKPFEVSGSSFCTRYTATMPKGVYVRERIQYQGRVSYAHVASIPILATGPMSKKADIQDQSLRILMPNGGKNIHITNRGGGLNLFPDGGDDAVSYHVVEDTCIKEYSPPEFDYFLRYMKRDLIYAGRSGDALHLIYREYVNDLARPAYTQNLYYDLSESKIIGFDGARISVDSADNTGITYTILSYFN